MLLSAIWQDADAAEVLFLIAAITFFLEAVLTLVPAMMSRRRIAAPSGEPVATRTYVPVGFFAAVGLVLVALGLLAL